MVLLWTDDERLSDSTRFSLAPALYNFDFDFLNFTSFCLLIFTKIVVSVYGYGLRLLEISSFGCSTTFARSAIQSTTMTDLTWGIKEQAQPSRLQGRSKT